MKNLKKLLYMFLVLAVGGFATSCAEDDVDSVAYSEGFGVYFSIDTPTEYMLEERQSSVEIPVYRSEAAAAEPCELNLLATYDDIDIFTVPYVVSFDANQTESKVRITFNFADITAGQEYLISLSLFEDPENPNVSAYGLQSIDITIKFDPWTALEGEAHYRDGAVAEFYALGFGLGLPIGAQSAVTIEQSDLNPSLYRIVEPYNADMAAQMLGPVLTDPSYAPYFITAETEYLYFIMKEDNQVYIADCETGLDLGVGGEGIPYFCSWVPECFKDNVLPKVEGWPSEPQYGTYNPETKAITFPAQGFYVACDLGGLISDTQGLTRIVFPGGIWMNPQVSASFVNLTLDSEMVRTITIRVEKNDDCRDYLLGLAEGDLSADAAALAAFAEGMLDGSIASTTYDTNGLLTLTYPGKGLYTIVFQPLGQDNGETKGAPSFLVFEDLSAEISPKDFEVDVTVTELTESRVALEMTPNTDKIYYYFDFMPTKDFNASLAAVDGDMDTMLQVYFADYVEYLNGTGYSYTLEEVLPQIVSLGADTYSARRLEPKTEYTYFIYPIDLVDGSSHGEVIVDTFTTLSDVNAPAGYKQWVGLWEVSSTGTINIQTGAIAEDTPTVVKQVSLSVDSSADGSYYMDGWDNEFTGYGIPVYWNDSAAQLEFRNNKYIGYDTYNALHMLFGAYVTYEMTIIEEGKEPVEAMNIAFVYDQENFMQSEKDDVCMVATMGADGKSAQVVGQEIKASVYLTNEEDAEPTEIDAMVAGMNVLGVDDQGSFFGIFVRGSSISLGDYTMKKLEGAPEIQSLQFRGGMTVPFLMSQKMQALEKESPKVQRMNDFNRNNYVLAR